MSGKRPFDGPDGSPDAKKPRTGDAPAGPSAASAAEEIARKKALVAAKFAAMRAQTVAPAVPAPIPAMPVSKAATAAKEALQRKIAETARKLQSQQGGSSAHPFLVRRALRRPT